MYRSSVGDTGTATKLELLLPTQHGTFILNNLHRLDTPTVTGVDWGSMTLADYHVNERHSTIGTVCHVCRRRWCVCVCSQPVDRNVTGLLRTTRVHDRLTPRMVAAFFHTNFSLTQERSTDVSPHAAVMSTTRCLRRASAAGRRPQMQHHLDTLPDRLPGDDEMQQTLGRWIAEGMAAKRQWEVDDRLAKEQAQRDEQFAQLEDNKAKFLQVCICGCARVPMLLWLWLCSCVTVWL